jgi:hypothetical protein
MRGATMISDEIRTKRNAIPFEPFVIRTKRGERYRVRQPEYVAIAPWNGTIAVRGRRGTEIVRADEVEAVEPMGLGAGGLIGRIREHRRRRPFLPFAVRTTDGRLMVVPARNWIAFSPDFRAIAVWNGDQNAITALSEQSIAGLEPVPVDEARDGVAKAS